MFLAGRGGLGIVRSSARVGHYWATPPLAGAPTGGRFFWGGWRGPGSSTAPPPKPPACAAAGMLAKQALLFLLHSSMQSPRASSALNPFLPRYCSLQVAPQRTADSLQALIKSALTGPSSAARDGDAGEPAARNRSPVPILLATAATKSTFPRMGSSSQSLRLDAQHPVCRRKVIVSADFGNARHPIGGIGIVFGIQFSNGLEKPATSLTRSAWRRAPSCRRRGRGVS